MDFEWDGSKRQLIIEERRVDILYAALIFEGPVLTRKDDRFEYGEERYVSIGLVEDECFVVVHTRRGNAIRLITAWKGGRDERAHHEAGLARGYREDEGEG